MEDNKKKTLVDEALLDIKVIQEALQKNTKEILRSTMHEEIDQIVKEYVTEEQGYEEEDIEDTDVDNDGDVDVTDVKTDVDVDDDSDDIEADEESGEESDEESDEESSEELPAPKENPIEEPEMDYDELDMTAASDEEVIKVFKKLSADDEIEVVSDTEVKITDPDSGNEYVVTTGSKPTEVDDETEVGIEDIEIDAPVEEPIEEPADESTEPVYEITLDEDIIRTATSDIETSMTGDMPSGDIDGQTAEESDVITGDNLEGGFTEENPNSGNDGHAEHVMEGDENVNEEEDEEEVDESMAPTGTHTDAKGKKGQMGGQRHQTPNTPRFNESVSKEKFNELLTVAKKLQAENKEVKQALREFRKMLAESVVYNTNLTYMVKIVTEHTTSNEEKQEIMKRFDNVKTLKESKSLYKTIVSELANKKPINESIEAKIEKSQSSGSSKQLTEATAYVDAETKRIKDLISRVENNDRY